MLVKKELDVTFVLHVWSIIFLQGNDFDRDVNVRKLLTDTNFDLTIHLLNMKVFLGRKSCSRTFLKCSIYFGNSCRHKLNSKERMCV